MSKKIAKHEKREEVAAPDEVATEERVVESPSDIEARMKSLEEEKQKLKARLVQVKEEKKVQRVKVREERDEKLAAIRIKLDAVLDAVYEYNKLGKAAKLQSGILDRVAKLALE